jgi:ribosomal protein L11 methyltransferase
VLDLGTGSGILAIAASILGARTVIGCDNDPVAAAVARENTERNRRDVQIFCGSADAILPASADLLLCNVTAEVIVSIFTEIDRIVKPGGMAVFSGILNSQRSMILNVMAGFRYVPLEENSRGEWVVWCGVKHGA